MVAKIKIEAVTYIDLDSVNVDLSNIKDVKDLTWNVRDEIESITTSIIRNAFDDGSISDYDYIKSNIIQIE